jgi:lipopolysaccharide export system permease protein
MFLLFISPSFLVFTVPTSILLGTLLTFGRLSADSEITAFKTSGTSLYQLFVPIVAYALVGCLFTGFLVFYGLPWGNRGFRAMLYLIAQSKADVEIKERVFNDVFDGLVVYVDKVPVQGKRMEGVLIHDERDKARLNTIFAREAFMINNPATQEVVLRLTDGDIHRFEPRNNTFQKVRFSAYDLRLELAKTFVALGRKLRDHEMSIDEIREKIRQIRARGGETTSLEVELHNRYAIPFACLIFVLIGVPLGIQPRRSGRSHGFIFSILILLAFYISLIAFEMFATRKIIPPLVASWAPYALFTSFGAYLFVKAANESPFKPALWLNDAIETLREKWNRFSNRV